MFVTWRDPAEPRDDGGSWRVTGPGVPSILRHARARLFPGLGWGELPVWGCHSSFSRSRCSVLIRANQTIYIN